MSPPPLLARHADSSSGTVAVVIFVFGAIVLVLVIILALLFFKKRRSASSSSKTFIPRLERQRGGNYGKLDEDEEAAWSADMGQGRLEEAKTQGQGMGRAGYAPVHDESMEYQSQTMQGGAAKDAYR